MTQGFKRSKFLRIALTASIALYVGVYVISFRYSLGYSWGNSWPDHWVRIGAGTFRLVSCSYSGSFVIRRGDPGRGWSLTPAHHTLWFAWWPRYWVDPIIQGERKNLVIPLWLPLLPLLAFAALLVYRDRTRRQPGHCRKCNYNLTGNTSGRCPECGSTMLSREPAP